MTPGTDPQSVIYRADIDGLRAVAVLLVLAFHFDLVPGARAGFIGVDVFFVISGFLITAIVNRQLQAGTFRLASFYLGRIRRLAPAFSVVLLGVMVIGSVTLFADDLIELSKQVLHSQFYLANFYYWRNVSYFGLGSDNVFLLHTWSLAVEEQFYLLYPITLLAIDKLAPRYLGVAIGVGLAISFGLNLAFVASKPEATFYLLPTRAWELLAGALVAASGASWVQRKPLAEVLGILGVVLVAAGVFFYRADIPFPGYYALLPVGGAVLILGSGTNQATFTSRLLSFGPLVYVGKISYPLYLVHWPLNVFASQSIGEQYLAGWRLAMFLSSFMLAALIYHLVEHPIRYRQLLRIDMRLLRAYGAGLATTVAIFLVTTARGGLPQRFPAEVSRIASFVNDKSPTLDECAFTGQVLVSAADFCHIGRRDRTPTWLVFGDSHAWAAHAAFDEWLKLKGESGLFMYRNSCPPVEGLHVFGDKGSCFRFNRSVSEFLSKSDTVKSVVLVSTWRQAAEGRLSHAADVQSSKEESVRLFGEKFSKTLALLHGLHKRVYIWEPVPGAHQRVPLALARATLAGRSADIEITRDQYMAENAFFFAVLQANREMVDVAFSPSEALCQSGRCAVTINGNPAYFDNAHVTRSSSEFWVRMMQRAEQAASHH